MGREECPDIRAGVIKRNNRLNANQIVWKKCLQYKYIYIYSKFVNIGSGLFFLVLLHYVTKGEKKYVTLSNKK